MAFSTSIRMGALALLALVAACRPPETNSGSDHASFYKDRTISIVVGFSAGGGNDIAARVVARHLGAHIPGNPRIIVQNMPGAGSFFAAHHVYDVAPKDGTTIALLVDPAPIAPLLKYSGADYDPHEVGWIGALSKRAASVVVVRTDAPVKTFADARKTEIALGTAGSTGAPASYARLLNELTGTKFKVIVGYPGAAETMLAIERGEVQGRAGTSWVTLKNERPEWVARNFVRPLVQLTLEPYPGLEGVPMAIDYVTNATDRAVMELALGVQEYSRIFSVAPGTPPERLAVLRKAFDEMVKDAEFIADAKRTMNDELLPSSHDKIEDFVRRAYAMPQEVRERAARYVASD